MKLTKEKLKELIKEEIQNVISENMQIEKVIQLLRQDLLDSVIQGVTLAEALGLIEILEYDVIKAKSIMHIWIVKPSEEFASYFDESQFGGSAFDTSITLFPGAGDEVLMDIVKRVPIKKDEKWK